MNNIEKPGTQQEIIDQLWFAIIGSNGDGIASIMKDLRRRLAHLEEMMPSMWTREEHDKAMMINAQEHADIKREREEQVEHRKNDQAMYMNLKYVKWGVVAAAGLTLVDAIGAVIAIIALRGIH